MPNLYEEVLTRVATWKADNYSFSQFPAIVEILEWAQNTDTGQLRFLRRPQLQALEAYWYLRLVEQTPHIFDLYQRIYLPDENIANLLDALAISGAAFKSVNYKPDTLWSRIQSDDGFVRDFKLEALRETLTLISSCINW